MTLTKKITPWFLKKTQTIMKDLKFPLNYFIILIFDFLKNKQKWQQLH